MFLLLPVCGCSTIGDARKARGQGMSRIYNASFDTVWAAAPKALNELGLSIAGENKGEGYILGQKGLTAFSYGENVAVFVEKVNVEQTKVEVVSKKTLATNVFAWNWEKPILDKLSEMLGNKVGDK
jgi:uncharacterized membrane protein YraQ (UPF0718 family)